MITINCSTKLFLTQQRIIRVISKFHKITSYINRINSIANINPIQSKEMKQQEGIRLSAIQNKLTTV